MDCALYTSQPKMISHFMLEEVKDIYLSMDYVTKPLSMPYEQMTLNNKYVMRTLTKKICLVSSSLRAVPKIERSAYMSSVL